jgi:hypothetical protein
MCKAGKQIYEILPEPTQPAKKQQVVTKPSKPFFSFLFASFSQFAEICRDLYYVFTTVALTGLVWDCSQCRGRPIA